LGYFGHAFLWACGFLGMGLLFGHSFSLALELLFWHVGFLSIGLFAWGYLCKWAFLDHGDIS
jgi:hypothetical protein